MADLESWNMLMLRGKKVFIAGVVVMAGASAAMLFRKQGGSADEKAEPVAVAEQTADPEAADAKTPSTDSTTPKAVAQPAKQAAPSATIRRSANEPAQETPTEPATPEPRQEPSAAKTPAYRPPSWASPSKSGPLKPLFPANEARKTAPRPEPAADPVVPPSRREPVKTEKVDRYPPPRELQPERKPTEHQAERPAVVSPAETRRQPAPAATLSPEPEVSAPPRIHLVRDGDNLESIARRYLGNANRSREIYEANRELLRQPDVLPIGVRLKIPNATVPVTNAPLRSGSPARPLVPIPPGTFEN